MSFEYPYKDKLGPGPGFFPFWLSIITGALSLALFFQTTRTKSSVEGSATLFPERQGALRILIIMVSLIVGLALLDPLGFRITLFLFLFFLPLGLGERNWWGILVFAIAGSFGIFHLFYYGLKVPLPMGVFGL
jgi:putative tricarboxylic transport membrane protein